MACWCDISVSTCFTAFPTTISAGIYWVSSLSWSLPGQLIPPAQRTWHSSEPSTRPPSISVSDFERHITTLFITFLPYWAPQNFARWPHCLFSTAPFLPLIEIQDFLLLLGVAFRHAKISPCHIDKYLPITLFTLIYLSTYLIFSTHILGKLYFSAGIAFFCSRDQYSCEF